MIFPKYRGDLLATAAIVRAMEQGAVEETRIPRNTLDVLAQQIVSMCATGERRVDDLFALVRRAAPYADLGRASFEGVLDMLSGRYPSDEFAELRPRITWDRLRGSRARTRGRAADWWSPTPGPIPDKGLYGVYLSDDVDVAPGQKRRPGRRVGELDEEMVFESFAGDVIVLGASSWRILEITRDRVLVAPAPGEPGRLPFWKADRPPRPVELGRAIGALSRELLAAKPESADGATGRGDEPRSQGRQEPARLPARPEASHGRGSRRPHGRARAHPRRDGRSGVCCLLTPFGGRVHAPWSLALQATLRKRGWSEVETIWSDDGIVIRIPDRDVAAGRQRPSAGAGADRRPGGGRAGRLVALRRALPRGGRRARCCCRAGRPGQRTPLWMQRKRAARPLGRGGALRVVPDHSRDVPRVPAGRLRRARPGRVLAQR